MATEYYVLAAPTSFTHSTRGAVKYREGVITPVADQETKDHFASLDAWQVINVTQLQGIPERVGELEAITQSAAEGFIPFETLSALNADLAHDAGTLVYVYGDSTASNNGDYVKSGASGSGSWAKTAAQRFILEATEAQAEAGTASGVVMTPRRVADYVAVQRGAASGLASLDANKKIPETQIPATAYNVDWLPVVNSKRPILVWESDRDFMWSNSRPILKADVLTDNGDGSFTLNETLVDADEGVTVFVEWDDAGHSGTPSGYFFGMVGNTTSLAGEIRLGAELGGKNNDAPEVVFETRVTSTVSTDRMVAWGARRAAIAQPSSGTSYRRVIENLDVVDDDTYSNTGYAAPVRVVIGADARNTRTPLANLTIKRVIIFAGALTTAELDGLMDATDPDRLLRTTDYPEWLPVLNDGAGGQIVPWCHIDQANGRAWLDGRVRAVSDVIKDNGDGTFSFIDIPKGLSTVGAGVAVMVDYAFPERYTAANKPSGCFFSYVGPSNASRLEFLVQQVVGEGTVAPGGVHAVSVFDSYTSQNWNGSVSFTGQSGVARAEGWKRHIVSIPPSGAPLAAADLGQVATQATSVSGTGASPWQIDLYRRALANDQASANVTLGAVTIYDTHLTEAQMWRAKFWTEHRLPPLFFYGDSLNNVAQPLAAVRNHFRDYGYIPAHSTGMGGRGLSYHLNFITAIMAENPEFAGYIPVIIEGGLDFTSPSYDDAGVTEGPYSFRDILRYYRDIFALFNPAAGVLVAPHTNKGGSSAKNTTPSATGDSWAALRSPGVSTVYQVMNVGDTPIMYQVASSDPGSNAGGKWLQPFEYTAPLTVDGASSEALYVKSAIAGAGGSVISAVDRLELAATLEASRLLAQTFPDLWCEWNDLMRAEAADDATFESLLKWSMSPAELLEAGAGDVHVNWIKNSTTNDPGGYWIMGLAIARKLRSLGYGATVDYSPDEL